MPHPALWSLPPYSAREELAHSLSHGLALVLSLIGLGALVYLSGSRGDLWLLTGCSIFGVTLVLLYAASTGYHAARHPPVKHTLRRLDHAAIFLLIAGTYTPFTLVNLRGHGGFVLFALVWGLAGIGIAIESILRSPSRRISVALHLLMGWLIVVALDPLSRSIEPTGLALLVAGGLAYTLGVVFYAWEKLPYNHAVWHLFVIAGSTCHFACVLGYVIPASAS